MNIVAWLSEIGFSEYADAFSENGVDAEILPELTNEDLKDLGVTRLGDRKRILKAIEYLDRPAEPADSPSREEWTMRGERRPVTVLFADLVDFTGLSNRLGAEKTHAILNSYFGRVDKIIQDYGGHIDKHIGDSAMAVFGAPVAHTNDPERAVRAALDIHEAMNSLSIEWDQPLAVHIGIACGQVVASGTGSDAHSEFTVTGRTVNLASRLDDLAGPGETYVSDAIRQAVSDLVSLKNRGRENIKGFTDAIDVWSVRELSKPGEASTSARIIGREFELRQFAAGLESCRLTGRGHGVLVRGDPGIGKSRLIYEFATLAEKSGFRTHRGLVLDFGTGAGHDAIGSLVLSVLRLSPEAGGAERQKAAEDAVSSGQIPETDKLHLCDLIDAPLSEEERKLYAAMEDQTRIAGRHAVLKTLIENTAQTDPCLVVVEDIHWADEVTRAYLSVIAETAGGCPAILVLSSRVEGLAVDSNWLASLSARSMTTIDLQPLSASDSLELAKLLGKDNGDTIEKLTARAEGNPLFLEQLIRNVAERSKDSLPDTLHGVVLSRVDGLPFVDREILQSASILGQRFSMEDLKGLMQRNSVDCQALVGNRLLRPEGADFIFAHALVREGVYASLLSGRRKELHRLAADWFADRDKPLHAEHLERAEDPGAADAYLTAVRAEMAQFHFTQALQLAQKGINIAHDRYQIFRLLHAKGEILLDVSDMDTALTVFGELLETAETGPERCLTLTGLAALMRLTDKLEEALPLLDEAQALGEAHGMREELSKLHHLRGNLFFPLGRTDACFAEHERALDYAKKAGLIEAEVRALGGLGDAEYARGRMRAAHRYFRECLDLSREHGFTRIEVANANMVGGGGTHYYLNELDASLQASSYAAEIGEKVGMTRAALLAHVSISMVRCEQANFDDAEKHARIVEDMANKSGTRRFNARAAQLLGKLMIERGDRADAVPILRDGIEISRATGVRYIGASILASLSRATDDPDEREDALRDGKDLLDQGCVSHNYFEYYCEGIELMLESARWGDVEIYASALEEFTSAEPLPRSIFFIERARCLAKFGAGDQSDDTHLGLRQLQEQAGEIGLMTAKRKLEQALAGGLVPLHPER